MPNVERHRGGAGTRLASIPLLGIAVSLLRALVDARRLRAERRAHRRALARISPKQRAAFLLHEWMGYTFAEAARVMGVQEATARVHCHRAKEALRKALGAEGAPVTPPRMQEQRS